MKANQKVGVYLASAVAVGLYLSGTHGGSLPGTAVPAGMAAVPAGGSYTSQSWASAFLAAIPEPQTTCNENAVEAWEGAEGGGVTNDAANNPLNTTQPEPGDWSIPGNPDGVKAYPSYQAGLQANVAAINNGLYGGVKSTLQSGDDAQAVADAVASSPWGTGQFTASC